MNEVVVSVFCVMFLVLALWIRAVLNRITRNDNNLNGLRSVVDKMNAVRKDDKYVSGSCAKVSSLILTKLKILNHVADFERND